MNKFKKKSKTKGLALGIAILSSAAVVSTGFAAWVIGGGDTQTTTNGTVKADDISNAEHTITDLKFTNSAIYFGAPETPNATANSWLSNNSEDKEKLVASGTFKVSNVKTDETVDKLFDTNASMFKETTGEEVDSSMKYATYNETGLKYVVTMSETVKFSDSKPSTLTAGYAYVYKTSTSSEGDLEYAFDVVFGWGSAFEGDNPYYYYNGKEKDDSLKSEANNRLHALHGMDAKFVLTIATK